MAMTLTICRGCLLHADEDGNGPLFKAKVEAIQARIEQQLGPVDLQLADCLHHCLTHEVCVRLERPGQRQERCAHLTRQNPLRDPVAVLLSR